MSSALDVGPYDCAEEVVSIVKVGRSVEAWEVDNSLRDVVYDESDVVELSSAVEVGADGIGTE